MHLSILFSFVLPLVTNFSIMNTILYIRVCVCVYVYMGFFLILKVKVNSVLKAMKVFLFSLPF